MVLAMLFFISLLLLGLDAGDLPHYNDSVIIFA